MVRGVRLVALLIVWLIPAVILGTATSWRWGPVWMAWRVPSAMPPFRDLRVVTTGVKTFQEGGNPLIANPNDPTQTPMNYPRIWLYLFSTLRIVDSDASIGSLKLPLPIAITGMAFCFFYLLCISVLILRSQSALGAMIIVLASLSPAPLLAIERANTDLLVFAIVFMGCIATNRYLKAAGLSAGALLKIYPLAAMVIEVIRKPAKERLVPIVLTLGVVASFTLQWRDILAIARATPINPEGSFGMLSLWMQAYCSNGKIAGVAAFLGAALVFVLVIRRAWLQPSPTDSFLLNTASGEMFAIFAGMYLFCFFVGCNYYYRLILLLPTIPLGIDLARSSRHRLLGGAYVALVLLAENAWGWPWQSIIANSATLAVAIIASTVLIEQIKSALRGTEPLVHRVVSPELFHA